MTREEAIRILKNFSLCGAYHQLIHMNDTDSEAISMAIKALEQPKSTRTFVELIVTYPDPQLCAYKVYKGKPYYSIKYIENGEEHVGYGTYNPEVLSQYLKEYFIPFAQPDLITQMQNGIKATDADDAYSCGMRNGMRWCISLIDDKEPLYENCPPAQPERKKGKWVKTGQSFVFPEKFRNYSCSECGHDVDKIKFNFCPNCGAKMINAGGEQE